MQNYIVPPDMVSVCSLCPYYRACSYMPVLVPYIPFSERSIYYKSVVFSCQYFVSRMCDEVIL